MKTVKSQLAPIAPPLCIEGSLSAYQFPILTGSLFSDTLKLLNKIRYAVETGLKKLFAKQTSLNMTVIYKHVLSDFCQTLKKYFCLSVV